MQPWASSDLAAQSWRAEVRGEICADIDWNLWVLFRNALAINTGSGLDMA